MPTAFPSESVITFGGIPSQAQSPEYPGLPVPAMVVDRPIGRNLVAKLSQAAGSPVNQATVVRPPACELTFPSMFAPGVPFRDRRVSESINSLNVKQCRRRLTALTRERCASRPRC
jgi:hypothetical protein